MKKVYSDTFKRNIVNQVAGGMSIHTVAEKNNLIWATVRDWVEKAGVVSPRQATLKANKVKKAKEPIQLSGNEQRLLEEIKLLKVELDAYRGRTEFLTAMLNAVVDTSVNAYRFNTDKL